MDKLKILENHIKEMIDTNIKISDKDTKYICKYENQAYKKVLKAIKKLREMKKWKTLQKLLFKSWMK